MKLDRLILAEPPHAQRMTLAEVEEACSCFPSESPLVLLSRNDMTYFRLLTTDVVLQSLCIER